MKRKSRHATCGNGPVLLSKFSTLLPLFSNFLGGRQPTNVGTKAKPFLVSYLSATNVTEKNVVISQLIVFVKRPGGLSDKFKLAKHRIRFSREFISFILLKPRDRHLVSFKTQSPSLPKLIFQPVLKFELDYIRVFLKSLFVIAKVF